MKVSRAVELVARMFDVGVKRVWVDPAHLDDVESAMTKDDLRGLIERGIIRILPKRGVSRVRARKIHEQKRKGRRRGHGSRKGPPGARAGKKELWVMRIRAIRRFLRELREKGKISASEYRRIYRLAKGGAVRSKRHVLEILREMRR